MITKTNFWKTIRLGFKDMKQNQEMTEKVMAIIKGEKNFESKNAGGTFRKMLEKIAQGKVKNTAPFTDDPPPRAGKSPPVDGGTN